MQGLYKGWFLCSRTEPHFDLGLFTWKRKVEAQNSEVKVNLAYQQGSVNKGCKLRDQAPKPKCSLKCSQGAELAGNSDILSHYKRELPFVINMAPFAEITYKC